MLVLSVCLVAIIFASLLGNYANFILGAMGVALLLMLFEPVQLMLKRRSVLQDIKRLKRLEKRRNQSNKATEINYETKK